MDHEAYKELCDLFSLNIEGRPKFTFANWQAASISSGLISMLPARLEHIFICTQERRRMHREYIHILDADTTSTLLIVLRLRFSSTRYRIVQALIPILVSRGVHDRMYELLFKL
jgi:hypothetical protein